MPKSYNNPNSWDKIENDGKKVIIDFEKEKTSDNSIFDNNDIIINDNDVTIISDNISDTRQFINESENFDEVLQLTQFDDSLLTSNNSNNYVVAEYNDIDTKKVQKRHEVAAKSFVDKITKFILAFKDVELSKDHQTYIKEVGLLQLQHLSDLLYLVDINKQIINNIVARINATQAEDYAIINSYNNLVNQHLKLVRELQTTYKGIPNTLKKMKTDVICNQELEENNSDEMITENFGESQFNNSKQLLKSLLQKRNSENNTENLNEIT